jgi:folate-binding protein YgfZ
MSAAPQTALEPLPETPVAGRAEISASSPLIAYQGALTPNVFSNLDQELAALIANAGVYDLGYKAYLQITGSDRLRWLNGMVSNAIQALPENHWNYNFLLNAQGRIQGDANVYRGAEMLLFQTDRSQITRLSSHLDHFIIMDDVELQLLDAFRTAIGIAGPRATEILTAFGVTPPQEGAFAQVSIDGTEVTLAHAHSPVVPRFEIWLPVTALAQIWTVLQNAGTNPAGVAAVEALRVLEGTPLYGIDIQDRHLAQETAQARALNFNKGCYLGQEIVERIRSRATVHRTLRQFLIENPPVTLNPGEFVELNAEGAGRTPVGELTSLAHYQLPAFKGALALGFIRTEAVEHNLRLTHSGGTAQVLDVPPRVIN